MRNSTPVVDELRQKPPLPLPAAANVERPAGRHFDLEKANALYEHVSYAATAQHMLTDLMCDPVGGEINDPGGQDQRMWLLLRSLEQDLAAAFALVAGEGQ